MLASDAGGIHHSHYIRSGALLPGYEAQTGEQQIKACFFSN